MKKRIIIGVHGLGNKPPGDLLREWWVKSINEGLGIVGKPRRLIPFELVYWADILYENPLDITITDTENPLYLDESYMPGNPDSEKKDGNLRTKILRFVERNLDKIFLNKNMTLNFEQLTDKIIHNYFKDLETYFADNCASLQNPDCSAKDEIRARLADKLKKYKKYDILLIGHSMGSIVAYDVLIQNDDIPDVHTVITIGSPLGLPIIVSRLYAEVKKINSRSKKLHAPDKIGKKWFNVSDVDDKVALDHTLGDDYAENDKGIRAEDIEVYNDYHNGKERNPHKAYGYLRTPEVAMIIDKFLGDEKRNNFYQGYMYLSNRLKSGYKHFKKIFGEKNES